MNLSDVDWVKLNQLLDEALDMDWSRRAQWLDSLPAELGTLTDTLRSLLEHSHGLDTDDVLLKGPPAEAAKLPALRSGEAVGPYRLIRQLGAGGTATVWLAERADGSLRRQVALKLPKSAWVDRGLAERLNSERDILASLEHPSIARLYDAGMDDAGRPYLALEYVQGTPLDRYAAERALSIPARLELFVRVARAVAFAHAHLVVHRDLKPSNVLVKENGEVRLLDFGIARLLRPDQRSDLPTPREGLALTPQYAAPEQFTRKPITVSTDVYSLGVLLYRLLSGRNPYPLERESLADLEDAIVNRDPASLTQGMDRRTARTVRGDLESIVRKAMSKEPADRYETVNGFIDDIGRFERKFPVHARPLRWSYRLARFINRRKVSVAAAALVVVALVFGVSAALWQTHVAQVEARRAERIKSFVASIFTQAVPKQGVGGVVTASDLLSAANNRIESELSDSRRDKSELQALIGESLLELGEAVRAGPVLQSALSNCEPTARDYELCRLRAAVGWADALMIAGEPARALRELKVYLPSSISPSSQLAQDFAVGLRVRAEALCHLKRSDESEAAHLRAIEFTERALGERHVVTLRALKALSYHYGVVGQRDKRLQIAERALTRALESRGHLRPDVLLSSIERVYGGALVGVGRSAEAVPLLRKVVADEHRLEPSDVHNMVESEWTLALALTRDGQFAEGIPLMQRWLEWNKQRHPVDSSERVEHLMYLSTAFGASRRVGDAIDTADRFAEMSARIGDISESFELRNMLVRARALAQSGAPEQAARLVDDVTRRSAVSRREALRLDALAVAAENARLQNRSSEAVMRALELQPALSLPTLTPITRIENLSIVAASFLSAGDEQRARAAYEQARGEYAKGGVSLSVRLTDLIIVGARLNLQSVDPRSVQELGALVAAWERVNPNSVWHAEALYWLARLQEASGQHEPAARNLQRALPTLSASPLPAMRRLASI